MSRRPRSNEGNANRSDATVGSDGNVEHYRVGPGRPPRQFQWKPGQSGNPRGGRRKVSPIAPDLKVVLEQALGQKVTLKQGEKEQIVTMARAGIEQLVAQFAKGDRYARRDIMVLAQKLGVDLTAGYGKTIEQALTADLTEDDEALLADYVRRHAREANENDRDREAPLSQPKEKSK
jgi:hypothetical protein